ncbi:hypothetical protein Bca52824_050849 [Brassica carinata]|uniref:Uncharacterized protein n=1 Tax=Brassica carinata TaxID=52824 RepID=A0A8X7UIC7_BRACI|nr:hypothetical protein Bca52824_050849 [Brassica carinata]
MVWSIAKFSLNFQASCSPWVEALRLQAASSGSSRLSHPVPDHQDGGVSVRRRQGGTFLSLGSVGSRAVDPQVSRHSGGSCGEGVSFLLEDYGTAEAASQLSGLVFVPMGGAKFDVEVLIRDGGSLDGFSPLAFGFAVSLRSAWCLGPGRKSEFQADYGVKLASSPRNLAPLLGGNGNGVTVRSPFWLI